jgi:transposase
MGVARREITLEFRTEAAHRVFDTGRTVRDVARELSVLENSPSKWVRDERRRMETIEGIGDAPLSPAERAELLRLRRQVAEQEKDVALLGKAAAYFASNPPKQRWNPLVNEPVLVVAKTRNAKGRSGVDNCNGRLHWCNVRLQAKEESWGAPQLPALI